MSPLDPQFVQNILKSSIEANLQQLLIKILPTLDSKTTGKIYQIIADNLKQQDEIYDQSQARINKTYKFLDENIAKFCKDSNVSGMQT
ncbi:MAG: hypothetical protein UR28_C0002G0035 [Candidatus Peregrinibacteria bacterium GW2011_GWF2_33_10]|nr:MAG: hypothetical protein UR28_C0002G0035 [Candidatus Peregrinibacteria bacterium GW2011_GWF2_33_10]OGJ45614.1 MAG: hypothetical protein A2263_00750 [Candidatus Peregrinibacteria bacterium RIFOXYA2_FULL_33_21]OGJ46777.1 MAG: hypothetical protein A2272_02565 [Candidatus Peregrinibacteria bacterium RIFOXYA12_FULL_33_12]OGJ51205.1 MAG: hypothetical protein A2307_01130 [Candidatus Peregrinibacteria bacterium RIFOXYB2_FULL_33_20]